MKKQTSLLYRATFKSYEPPKVIQPILLLLGLLFLSAGVKATTFECVDDYDCPNSSLITRYCDHDTYSCVDDGNAVCDTMAQCKSNLCQNYTCQSCLVDGDCQSIGQTCDGSYGVLNGVGQGKCVTNCSEDSDCLTEFREEFIEMYCVSSLCQTKTCAAHSECTNTNFCDGSTGQCSRCSSDSDCNEANGSNPNNYYCQSGICSTKYCPGTGALTTETSYILVAEDSFCSQDVQLVQTDNNSSDMTIDECYALCQAADDCEYFAYGTTTGQCGYQLAKNCREQDLISAEGYNIYRNGGLFHGSASQFFYERPTYGIIGSSVDTHDADQYCSTKYKAGVEVNESMTTDSQNRKSQIKYQCMGHSSDGIHHSECYLTNFCNSSGQCASCTSDTDCGEHFTCSNSICSDSRVFYLSTPTTSCPDGERASAYDCVNSVANSLTDYSYAGESAGTDRPFGCWYDSSNNSIYYNTNTSGTTTNSNVGTVCFGTTAQTTCNDVNDCTASLIDYCVDGICTESMSCTSETQTTDCSKTGYCGDAGICATCDSIDNSACNNLFYMTNVNENCSNDDMIKTASDCETAAAAAGKSYNSSNLDLDDTSSGCVWVQNTNEIHFNINLESNPTNLDKGVCLGTAGLVSEDNYYFLAESSTNCATENLIVTSAQCQTAANAIGGSYGVGASYDGEETNELKPIGCHFSGVDYTVRFNKRLTSDPTGQENTTHGLCWARKTEFYIASFEDTYCPEADLIKTSATCQIATDQIDGNINWSQNYSSVNNTPYCSVRTENKGSNYYIGKVLFNDDASGQNDGTYTNATGVCRVGGMQCTESDESTSCSQTDLTEHCVDYNCSTSKACTSNSECSRTNYCSQSGVCALCTSDSNPTCEEGSSCQSISAYAMSNYEVCVTDDLVTDVTTCQYAATELGLSYISTDSNSSTPYGCVLWISDAQVYFNTDSTTTTGARESPVCQKSQYQGTCQVDTCTTDSDCKKIHSTGTNSIDLYCLQGLCRPQACSSNSECANTSFCNTSTSVCSYCLEGDSCEADNSCQYLQAYQAPDDQSCVTEDIISTEDECISAAFDLGFTYNGAGQRSNRAFGCYYNSNQSVVYFNRVTTGVANGDAHIFQVCRKTENANKCIVDVCTSDSQCHTVAVDGQHTADLYCISGQCRTKTCSLDSECTNTLFCHDATGLCSHCESSDTCDDGSTCQSLSAYITPTEGYCVSADIIDNATTCEAAGSQMLTGYYTGVYEYPTVPYGCFYVESTGTWAFNSEINVTSYLAGHGALCNHQYSYNKCVVDACSQDADCGTQTESDDGRKIDLFCINKQCISQTCSSNGNCPDTGFCDFEHGVCSYCIQGDSCDSSKTCQYLQAYETPSICYGVDLITERSFCTEAGVDIGYGEGNQVTMTNRAYGCYSNSNLQSAKFNTETSGVYDGSTNGKIKSLCRKDALSNTCQPDLCTEDSECSYLVVEGSNMVDYYCQAGQCRQKTCSLNSDCVDTSFCNTETGVCSYCLEGDSCEAGNSCQYLQAYQAPNDQGCVSEDIIYDAFKCELASYDLGYPFQGEVAYSGKAFGCYYNDNGIRFNSQQDGIASNESDIFSVCRKTENANKCIADTCSIDSDCHQIAVEGENTVDLYCISGQCRTKTCSLDSECTNTLFCHATTGLCSFCESNDSCDSGSTCQTLNAYLSPSGPCVDTDVISNATTCEAAGSQVLSGTYYGQIQYSDIIYGCFYTAQIFNYAFNSNADVAAVYGNSPDIRFGVCNNQYAYNKCVVDACSQDSDCGTQTETDDNKRIDLYCINNQCIPKVCSSNAECLLNTSYCDLDHGVCSYCEEGDSCDSGSVCQAISPYTAPTSGECISIDNITDADLCEFAGSQSSLSGSYTGQVSDSNYPFGCTSLNQNWFYNSDTNGSTTGTSAQICRKELTENTCQERECSEGSDYSECSTHTESNGKQFDLYCSYGLCRSKGCFSNSDCTSTNFCDPDTNLCSFCDETSSCDQSYTCQTISPYKAPGGTTCVSEDFIPNASLCEQALTQIGYQYQIEIDMVDRFYGCYYNNAQHGYFNTNASGTDSRNVLGGVCRKTSTDINICLANTCSTDSECTTTPISGENTPDNYCILGQCRTQTCVTSADCPTTTYCDQTTLLCSYCNDTAEVDQCDEGYSCQFYSPYQKCLEDQCSTDNEDDNCSQDDLNEHCYKGQCTTAKPCESNNECGRTNFCNSEGFCSICGRDDTDQATCDDGSTCQPNEFYGGQPFYQADVNTSCYQLGIITDYDTCQLAAAQFGHSFDGEISIATEFSVLEENRAYSSTQQDNTDYNYANSELDASTAWVANYNNLEQWLILDAGEQVHISGVLVQGRNDFDTHEIVTIVSFQYSDDQSSWIDVQYDATQDAGQKFNTGVVANTGNTKYKIQFDATVQARYLKIIPQAWESQISMRVGLLTTTLSTDQIFGCRQTYVNESGVTVSNTIFSSDLESADTIRNDFALCYDHLKCLVDTCTTDEQCNDSLRFCEDDDYCKSNLTQYCRYGQCRNFNPCTDDSECSKTNLCKDSVEDSAAILADYEFGLDYFDGSKVCSLCSVDDADTTCAEGWSCQFDYPYDEQQCLLDVCTIPNHEECRDSLIEYCIQGQCFPQLCSENYDCPRTNHCSLPDTDTERWCAFCNNQDQLCPEAWTCQLDFVCLEDVCSYNDECEGSDYYCILGQCILKACTSGTECEKTFHCASSGFCGDCNDENETCMADYTCQMAIDETCWLDQCDVYDHFTCEEGFHYYCELGQCQLRDCYNYLEVECPKLSPPVLVFAQQEISITRTQQLYFDVFDYLGEDPNGEDFSQYSVSINLGQATKFLSQESSSELTSIYYDTMEEYNIEQALLSSATVDVSVTNVYGQTTTASIDFEFKEDVPVIPGCRRRLKKRDLQDEIAETEDENSDLPDCPEEEGMTSDGLSSEQQQDEEVQEEAQDENAESENSELDPTGSFAGVTGYEIELANQENVNVEPLRRSITVDERGLLTILFSKDMSFPINLVELIINGKQNNTVRHLRKEILAINIIGAGDQSSENLELDWDVLCNEKIVKIDNNQENDITMCELPSKKQIQIQIDFKHALEISQSGEPDMIVVEFKDISYFVDPDASKLKGEDIVNDLSFVLPGQMPKECKACDQMIETVVVAEDATTTVVATSFIISMLVGMAKNVLFSLISMMQMYVYLPLLDITFPGNIQAYLLFFMGLASCDFFTDKEIFRTVFSYNPTVGLEPYSDNFENLGFETASMTYNLGDLAVIQFYVLVLFLFLLIARLAKMKDRVRQFSHTLFWNFPLRYMISGYMELAFGSLIKFYSNSYTFVTNSDAADTVLAIFWLAMITLVPIILFIITNIKQETIQKQGSFFKRISTIFGTTHLKTTGSLNYTSIFLARRMLIVTSIFYLQGRAAVFQAIFIVMNNLVYAAYILSVKPFIEKHNFYTEMITESCSLVFGYIVMCYTYFVPQAQTRFQMGWAGIGIASFNLLINMILIFNDIWRALKKGAINICRATCKWAKNNYCCQIFDCFGLIKVPQRPFIYVNGKRTFLSPRTAEKLKKKEEIAKRKNEKAQKAKAEQELIAEEKRKFAELYKNNKYQIRKNEESESSSELEEYPKDYEEVKKPSKIQVKSRNVQQNMTKSLILDQSSQMDILVDFNSEEEDYNISFEKQQKVKQSKIFRDKTQTDIALFLYQVAYNLGKNKDSMKPLIKQLREIDVHTCGQVVGVSAYQWKKLGVDSKLQSQIKSFLPKEALQQQDRKLQSKFKQINKPQKHDYRMEYQIKANFALQEAQQFGSKKQNSQGLLDQNFDNRLNRGLMIAYDETEEDRLRQKRIDHAIQLRERRRIQEQQDRQVQKEQELKKRKQISQNFQRQIVNVHRPDPPRSNILIQEQKQDYGQFNFMSELAFPDFETIQPEKEKVTKEVPKMSFIYEQNNYEY